MKVVGPGALQKVVKIKDWSSRLVKLVKSMLWPGKKERSSMGESQILNQPPPKKQTNQRWTLEVLNCENFRYSWSDYEKADTK